MARINYEKLLEDLKSARDAAIARIEGMQDDYPFNFDAAALSLPRADKDKVLAIISEAGLLGYVMKRPTAFHIRGPSSSGSRIRTEQATAIVEVLSTRGWNVSLYEQLN